MPHARSTARCIAPLLGLLSLLLEAARQGWRITAFEWPGINMGPYFERARDPAFLAGDFITDGMSAASPRMVFAAIVHAVNRLGGWEWWQGYLLLKLLCVVLVPPLMFAWVARLAAALGDSDEERRESTLVPILAGCAVALLLLTPRLQGKLSIGGYSQTELKATAQGVATLLALGAAWIGLAGWRMLALAGFFGATLVHPTVGALLYGIFFVFTRVADRSKIWLAGLATSILVPFTVLKACFGGGAALPADEFIRIYVKTRLPHHYDLASQPLARTLRTLAAHVATLGLCARVARTRATARIALCFAVLVPALVALQWIGIDFLGSKAIALLAPVRIAAFLFLIVAPFVVAATASRLGRWTRPFRALESVTVARVVPAAILAALVCAGWIWLAEAAPLDRARAIDPALYAWIAAHTSDADVFAAPVDDLADQLEVLARRRVFVNQILPFNESYYREYQRRWLLLFGPERDRRDAHYHGLARNTVAALMQREGIDYFLVESGKGSALEALQPAFRGARYLVYSRASIAADPR